jgi:choline dehydrogenase-like flavoprotein
MLTLRSPLAAPGGPPDLHLFAAGAFDDAASPAGGVFGIVAGLLAVRSRGSVRLRSADPADPPRIDVAHLRHPEDMTRMIEATRHARQLSRTPPLAGFVAGAELAPGPAIGDDDTAGLARSIRERAGSYHHPVGTCAMDPNLGDGAAKAAYPSLMRATLGCSVMIFPSRLPAGEGKSPDQGSPVGGGPFAYRAL